MGFSGPNHSAALGTSLLRFLCGSLRVILGLAVSGTLVILHSSFPMCVCIVFSDVPQPGGLFKGLTATALRESIGNVCFFVTYESVKRHLTRALEHWTSQQGTTIGSGAAAHAPSVEGQRAGLEGAVKASGVRSAVAEAVTGLVSGGLAGIAVSLQWWHAIRGPSVRTGRFQSGRCLYLSCWIHQMATQ